MYEARPLLWRSRKQKTGKAKARKSRNDKQTQEQREHKSKAKQRNGKAKKQQQNGKAQATRRKHKNTKPSLKTGLPRMMACCGHQHESFVWRPIDPLGTVSDNVRCVMSTWMCRKLLSWLDEFMSKCPCSIVRKHPIVRVQAARTLCHILRTSSTTSRHQHGCKKKQMPASILEDGMEL